MKKLLVHITVLVLLLMACHTAFAATEYSFAFVNANRVNLRKTPGGDLITRLDMDTCVYIADTREHKGKQWHYIITSVEKDQKQLAGWMDASFLTDVSYAYANVVQAAAGNRHVLLRMADGSAAAFGFPFRTNLDVRSWGRVTDIAAGRFASYGLSEDGMTVYGSEWAQDNNLHGPLTAVRASARSDYFGAVTADGAFVCTENPFVNGGWDMPFDAVVNAETIADAEMTMSVMAVITDKNVLHVAVEADYIEGVKEAEGLENVRAVALGNRDLYTLMLDGTVRCFGTMDDEIIRRVSTWQNVQAITAGNGFVAALMQDGSVSFAGTMVTHNWNYRVESSETRVNLQDEGLLAGWTDMASISAGEHMLVGVTNEGELRVLALYAFE